MLRALTRYIHSYGLKSGREHVLFLEVNRFNGSLRDDEGLSICVHSVLAGELRGVLHVLRVGS